MSKTIGKKKSYRRRKSGGKKQTPVEKILEYMLGLKEEVLKREVMPRDSGRLGHLPYNPFTKHQCGGSFNMFMLQVRAFGTGWTDPRFVTRGKAKELKADFRGQRMTQLWYPMQRKEVNEDTGEEEVVGVYYRPFFVFNVEQFANLAELDIPPLAVSEWGDTPAAERIEAVREHVLANFKSPTAMREEAMIRVPHYRPATHEVVPTPTREYRKPECFAQSMIHELVHATGAPGELDRLKVNRYGSPRTPRGGDYAYEEMVTQFSTASLLTQYGFAHERKTSADYIVSWYRAIEDKPELLGGAIKDVMAVVRKEWIDAMPEFVGDMLLDISDLALPSRREKPKEVWLALEYIDCACDENYIKPAPPIESVVTGQEVMCGVCRAAFDDRPNSRLGEVLAAGLPFDEHNIEHAGKA